MSVNAEAAQAACMGCCLNPGFINPFGPYINPNPFTYDPLFYKPSQPNYLQQQTFQTTGFPTFIDNLTAAKLTPEERDLLKKLGEAYNMYTALDKRSEGDNKEFVDALHRLQQLVALRVARRVDPDVWSQPE
jgi:hypothetical protein